MVIAVLMGDTVFLATPALETHSDPLHASVKVRYVKPPFVELDIERQATHVRHLLHGSYCGPPCVLIEAL